jgi:hypothetical protein
MVKRAAALGIGLFITLICTSLLLSGEASSSSVVPPSVSFSGESNVMYFFDRESGKIYRYNTQGRLTRTYRIEELGKDLQMR